MNIWAKSGIAVCAALIASATTYYELAHRHTSKTEELHVALVRLSTTIRDGGSVNDFTAEVKDARTKFELAKDDLWFGRLATCENGVSQAEQAMGVVQEVGSSSDQVPESVADNLIKMGEKTRREKLVKTVQDTKLPDSADSNESAEMFKLKLQIARLSRQMLNSMAVNAIADAVKRAADAAG